MSSHCAIAPRPRPAIRLRASPKEAGLSTAAIPAAPAIARGRSTGIGLGAILLWGLLAPLAVAAGQVPPFLLTGLAFLIGGLVGLLVQLLRRRPLRACFEVPARAWVLGVGGLFGYHLVYFTALRLLPPVEALLVINTWPLLIILFSALLPGQRLLPRHVLGGLLGLLGSVLIVLGRDEAVGVPRSGLGYLLAVAAALIWSGYSVLNRRLAADAPTDAVTGFCLVTGLLACLAHALLETPGLPEGGAWLAVLALGLGPVGAAFYLWDHGTKHGDLRVLGASAYAAPLIGTVLLVLMGRAEPDLRLLLAAVLIVGGAVLASGEFLKRQATEAR